MNQYKYTKVWSEANVFIICFFFWKMSQKEIKKKLKNADHNVLEQKVMSSNWNYWLDKRSKCLAEEWLKWFTDIEHFD